MKENCDCQKCFTYSNVATKQGEAPRFVCPFFALFEVLTLLVVV